MNKSTTQGVIGFICQGKGLPEYFEEDLVMTIVGLHDMCKSVDWIAFRAKQILNEEGKKEVDRLRQDVYDRVKSFNRLEMIAFKCSRENRVMNEEEIKFTQDFLDKNKVLVAEYLTKVTRNKTNDN